MKKKGQFEKKVIKPLSINPTLLARMEVEAEKRMGGNFSRLASKVFEAYLDGKIKLVF